MELKTPDIAQSFFRNSILLNFLYQMGNLVSAPRSRPQIVHHGVHDTGGGSLGRLWGLVETLKDEAEANAQLARQKLERRRQRPSRRGAQIERRITALQRGSVRLTLRRGDMGMEVSPVKRIKVHRFEEDQSTGANNTSVEVQMHHSLGE
ncbi:MAG: hypothetical protein L6R37_004939 [Teloschistes peruensis]|nr:MAG: hypothetical protein L6R37_004939 [Teloschistes peruensis]